MGFIFDNKHSGDMGVVFKSTDRTLLPAKRVTQYTIPGKSGTYDIEAVSYTHLTLPTIA